jgi:hypothetical protein
MQRLQRLSMRSQGRLQKKKLGKGAPKEDKVTIPPKPNSKAYDLVDDWDKEERKLREQLAKAQQCW